MDIPIVEILATVGSILAGMWAMFERFNKSVAVNQSKFLEYIEKKNGHMERIAKEFNQTVREFQGTVSAMSAKLDSIDERV